MNTWYTLSAYYGDISFPSHIHPLFFVSHFDASISFNLMKFRPSIFSFLPFFSFLHFMYSKFSSWKHVILIPAYTQIQVWNVYSLFRSVNNPTKVNLRKCLFSSQKNIHIKWNIHSNFNIFPDKGMKREGEEIKNMYWGRKKEKVLREENSSLG